MELGELLPKYDILSMRRVLVVQPHPDDAEVGAGDVIAKLHDSGAEIHYLTATDGSLGVNSPDIPKESIVAIRKMETEASGRYLGVDGFTYLDEKDGALKDVPALAGRIAEVIRSYRPDLVLSPDPYLPYESHMDHIVTAKATSQAVISSSLMEYPRGTSTTPHSVTLMAYYLTAKPNVILDVSTTLVRRFKAMEFHKSQFSDELLALYRVYFTNRATQLAVNEDYTFGAGLKILPPLMMHCFTEADDYIPM